MCAGDRLLEIKPVETLCQSLFQPVFHVIAKSLDGHAIVHALTALLQLGIPIFRSVLTNFHTHRRNPGLNAAAPFFLPVASGKMKKER